MSSSGVHLPVHSDEGITQEACIFTRCKNARRWFETLCAELIKTGASLDLTEDTHWFLVKQIRKELGDLREVMKEMRRQLRTDSTRLRAAAARKTIAQSDVDVREESRVH